MRLAFRDLMETSERVRLANGMLRVPARLARTGVQTYRAGELGLDDRDPAEVIRIYRPPEEVFAPESMATFSMAPVTDDHPADDVTAANARSLAVGWLGERIERDGQFVTSTLLIADEAVIAKIEARGKVELSNGYTCALDWTEGRTPEGETFDAVQRSIVGNHVALVDAGRCGPACRIADKAPAEAVEIADCGCEGEPAVADALKKIIVDGLGLIDVNDAAEAALTHLQSQLKTARDALAAAEGQAAASAAAQAAALAAKDGEIATLKASVSDTATLDARVAARAKLIVDAKRLAGANAAALVTDGKSDADIQREAVTARLGDAAVKDRPEAFFAAAFDTLVAAEPEGQGQGAARDAMQAAHRPAAAQDRRSAEESYEDRMSKAWRGRAAA